MAAGKWARCRPSSSAVPGRTVVISLPHLTCRQMQRNHFTPPPDLQPPQQLCHSRQDLDALGGIGAVHNKVVNHDLWGNVCVKAGQKCGAWRRGQYVY